ncbi:MAG: PSD1 and planctomycete cytochrome C domain-containing protein [Pirellula sp.]
MINEPLSANMRASIDLGWMWLLVVAITIVLQDVGRSADSTATSNNAAVTFERDVRPIFKAMCFQCHGEEPEPHGGIDLRLVQLITSGGESGPGITAGNPESSLLWRKIESDEMPEGPKKLNRRQKQIIRDWIEQGAKTVRPEPADAADARFSEEELSFWAFQPPTTPNVPDIKGDATSNPIDAFLLDRLAEKGLRFSPEADRRTMIRRLKLDLHGLLPSQAEVEEFLKDDSPGAYESLVDRLLESPQYGVRWARHWLDVAGYSESDGNQGKDRDRPYAWRYRDYVIASFNDDKPYDQFVREQLAGDELIEGEIDPENERHVELLTATGLLRMAPDVTDTDNTLIDRNQAVADVVKVVSSSILGLTVGCAQCHDHRYDPISIQDYYQFRAIFDPAFPMDPWKKPSQRLVDMTCAADRAKADEIEAEAVNRENDIKMRKREVGQKILDLKLAEVPEDLRPAILEAIAVPANKQTPEQKKLLFNYPMVRSIDAIVGQLVEFDKVFNSENYRKFEAEAKELAKFRETKPPKRMIMAVQDAVQSIPESVVLFRGDPEQRKQSVNPSEIFVLTRNRRLEPLPLQPEKDRKSVGRRLAYAKQLTDGAHPLVARVAVNRMWQHHFGVGLVASPGDFGAFGQRPTHPEMLDYLANDFVQGGWRMKRLHRAMVTSRAYRQRSTRTATLDQIDSDNRLYGRMHLKRMDAESIRDAILQVSGKLNLSIVGPSVPIVEDGEGRATIGGRKEREGLFAGVEDMGEEKNRRSIFLQSKRTLPLNILETFDMPVMNPNCDTRRCSTVTPQSLLFLNDQTIVESADAMSELIWAAGEDTPARLQALFQAMFSMPATDTEIQQCEAYLAEQRELFAGDQTPDWKKRIEKSPNAPDVRALASLCQSLMASNRFLYID